MASITNDGGGRRRIQFVDTEGNRRAIRLGKVSERRAEEVKFRVERILEAKITGFAIEAETARWIAELPDALADKLARVKLIPSRTPATLLSLSRSTFLRGQSPPRLTPPLRTVCGIVLAKRTRRDRLIAQSYAEPPSGGQTRTVGDQIVG